MIIYTRSITKLQIRFGWWNWWGLLVEVHVEYMVETSNWLVVTYMKCIVDDVGTYWWVIVDEYLTYDWYILGTWLYALVMVQVDYMLFGTGWCMVDALVYGTGWLQVEVHVDAWLMHGSDLLVQVYSSISHSDSVTVVPSFYFYIKVIGWGKDKSFYPPSGCS